MALHKVLLLGLLINGILGQDFQGGTLTFAPVARYRDGMITISFHYKQSYGGRCQNNSNWSCSVGDCGQIVFSEVEVTDEDHSERGLWCQSEGHILRNVSRDRLFTLSDTNCCWTSNLNSAGNWTMNALVDMGTRSDTSYLNKAPVTTTIPAIRIPQNCFFPLKLLTHDPDGDQVICRFGTYNWGICQTCDTDSNFTLNEGDCSLLLSGTPSMGVHVFEMFMVDYPIQPITLSYRAGESIARNPVDNYRVYPDPLSIVPLQFSIEILPPIHTCTPGVLRPQFLVPTPPQGDVQYAAIGHSFELTVQAEATQATIHNFQISGPVNMRKESRYYRTGIAQLKVNWTPQESDAYRHVPICFSAETMESQSEMRCIVVIVERSAVKSGSANVSCTENTMAISLSKASMQGIDENQLRLKDPSCSLTSNGTYITGIVSLNTCGTKVEDVGDYIIFRNEVDSVKLSGSIITRRQLVKIPFECRYPKTSYVSASFKNHKSDYVFTESGFGSFSYSIEFYTDNTFNNRIDPSTYPVEVQLLDMIYVGIQAHSVLPEVQLFVESCRATPDDDPNGSLYYDIIRDGCRLDETLVVHPANQTEFKIEVQAFKFTGDFDQVYLSCMVVLCEAGSPSSRCSQGCVHNAEVRRRRGLSLETEKHYISQGPLHLVKPSQRSSAASDDGSSGVKSSWGTMVFAGLFVIALLVLVGVTGHNAMKNRSIFNMTRRGQWKPMLAE